MPCDAKVARFTKLSREAIKQRAGGWCCMCDVPTLGPDESDATKSLDIGEAAHIHSPEPNGPRHRTDWTRERFDSVENGLWLCGNCHKPTDVAWKAYAAATLVAIKAAAEQRALQRRGKPIGGVGLVQVAGGFISVGHLGSGAVVATGANHVGNVVTVGDNNTGTGVGGDYHEAPKQRILLVPPPGELIELMKRDGVRVEIMSTAEAEAARFAHSIAALLFEAGAPVHADGGRCVVGTFQAAGWLPEPLRLFIRRHADARAFRALAAYLAAAGYPPVLVAMPNDTGEPSWIEVGPQRQR